ncbi:unnamed protein product, partial [Adineta ricciae]
IIFCNDINKYSKYSKSSHFIDICVDYNSLKESIERIFLPLTHDLDENRQFNTIRFLKTKSSYNTNAVYSYMLFVEILKEVPQTDQAKDYMLNKIKDWNRFNPTQLEYIETFRNTYKPNQAIKWYTEQSFMYIYVNRAFRTENVSMWYLFRFYIKDLCEQIEQVYHEQNNKECLILYRGQGHLPKQEFENICSNIGGLISTNGFLSSTKSFPLAEFFLGGAHDTETSCAVIFEITVDAKNLKSTIFVDISQHLPELGEEEILFNIGTIFQIDSVEREEDFWRIKIHATDDGSMEIKDKMDLMKKKFKTTNLNLLFGRLLIDMGLFDKAQSYFNLILQILPEKHQDLPLINDHLGDLQMRIPNYNKAFKHFQLSLNLKEEFFSKDCTKMCITYNHLGNYYKAIEDTSKAFYYYEKTLKYEDNLINIGITKLNLSSIYLMKREFEKAEKICLDAHEIFHKLEPPSYGEILLCQGILGDISFERKGYQQAESFYHVAFDMAKKYFSFGDSRLINCINALANFYQKQGNTSYALYFCYQQLNEHKKYLSDENHLNIAQIYMKIADLLNDKNYYRRALKIFQNNLRKDYFSNANCLLKLASFYSNEQSLYCYIKANKLYKKIYPKNHSSIIKTQKQIDELKKMNIIEKSFEQEPILIDYLNQFIFNNNSIHLNNQSSSLQTLDHQSNIEL